MAQAEHATPSDNEDANPNGNNESVVPDAASAEVPAAEPSAHDAPAAEPREAPASETSDVASPGAEASAPAPTPEVPVSANGVASPDAVEGPPAPPAGAAAAKRPAAPSKIVEGVVTAVSSNEVELKLDDGRPAVITRRNFAPDDTDPTEIVSVGDRAFGAELAREDPKQRVALSRTWALKRKAWDQVMQTAGLNESLSGTVVSLGSKGIVVDVGVRGFVPSSHLELEPIKDLSPYMGQTLELKVLEADPKRERLVLSRRSLLLKEQRKKSQELLAQLEPGQTCTGKVSSLTDYGAFVDLGGVNGLVHLSELSWQRVRKASDILALGDEVEVQVLDVKPKKRRVSLSIRRLTPDPLSAFAEGEVLQGRVTRLVDFGAFVSLGEIEGLVHLSELAEYRVSTPEEVVAPGDEVGVKVLSVDTKRRRVELSIRRAAEFGG